MIDGITDDVAVEEATTQDAQLATVGEVYSDGLTLIFDGQSEATQKHYKCNTAVSFSAGDRVKVAKISGSYVVEYVIGAPNSGGGAGVTELVNGDYKVTLDSKGHLVPTGNVSIGTPTAKFNSLYAGGFVSPSSALVGFYGGIGALQATTTYKTITSANQVAALQAVMNRLVALGIFK